MAKANNPDRGLFQLANRQGVLEWWIQFSDAQGRRRREKAGSKTAARQLYAKRKEEARIGKKLPENLRERPKTIAEVLKQFEPVFAAKKSARDDRRYAAFMREAFGDYVLSELTSEDVEKWRRGRLKDGKAPATANRAVAFFKRVFNLAIQNDLFPGPNPVAKVKQIRENNSRVRYLTDEEEAQLRLVCTPELWRKVEIAFLSGLRQSEQFKLRREDLDFGARVITVRESKHGEKRTVRMSGRLVELFEVQLASSSSSWVFPGQDPRDHYRGRSAIGALQTALRRAGIANFKWHDLRHTFCSRLAMAGVSLTTIQQLAGHKTISVTQRYAHLSPEHLVDAMEKLATRSRPALILSEQVLDDPERLVAMLEEHVAGDVLRQVLEKLGKPVQSNGHQNDHPKNPQAGKARQV